MKKLLSTLLLIGMLILVSYRPSAIIKNDLLDLGLKGKVKTLTETEFKVVNKFGEIQKGEIIDKDIYTFNEIGNKIEKTHYGSDGSLIENDIYKYDDKGNKTEENQYNSAGSLTSKSTYKYSDKDNMTEEEEDRNIYN
jgi:hypothetical protein